MGNIKTILGDKSVEEFERMRNILLNPREDLTYENMNENETEAFNYVYDVWLPIEGIDKANELLTEYKDGEIYTTELTEYINKLVKAFMKWVKDFE